MPATGERENDNDRSEERRRPSRTRADTNYAWTLEVAEITDLTLEESAAAVRTGDLSPAELGDACLRRIDMLEDEIKAFVFVEPEQALESRRTETKGPLPGVPLGIKDLIDVAGMPTTASSRVLTGKVAPDDASVVGFLRHAGGTMIGKTNTHEFAYGVVTNPTRNPWDTDRIPGGSSGGSAAAVAAGMCLGSLGTDTAGSIRIPSALCGVTGLMSRPDALPMDGIIPLAPSLDRCGPIARTASGVDLLWQALSGAPPAAPSRSPRIAVPRELETIVDVHAEVQAAFDAAVTTLSDGGARKVPVDLPSFDEWSRVRLIPLMVEALVAHRRAGWYPGGAHLYAEDTRASLARAERFTAVEYVEARAMVAHLRERLMSAFADADVLALPTTPVPAPTGTEAERTEPGSLRRPVNLTLTRICGPINHCDLAAISVPCGLTSKGLPVGMQFVAPDEATVLGCALFFQEMTDHHTRRPLLNQRSG